MKLIDKHGVQGGSNKCKLICISLLNVFAVYLLGICLENEPNSMTYDDSMTNMLIIKQKFELILFPNYCFLSIMFPITFWRTSTVF